MFRRFLECAGLLALTTLPFAGCSEDPGPDPAPPAPLDPAGIVDRAGDDTHELVLFWRPGSTESSEAAGDAYHVYRRIGGAGEFERLTSEPILAGPMDPDETDSPDLPHYVIRDFDLSSESGHEYCVKTVSTEGGESEASETVALTPSQIDLEREILDLRPNDEHDVAPDAPLSWRLVDGAESYVLYLQEHGSVDHGGSLWFTRFLGAPTRSDRGTVLPGSTEGVTYIDELQAGTSVSREYEWGVFALDANNCAIAEGHARFSTFPMVRTLSDEVRDAGIQNLTWDQLDDAGAAVAPGTYQARLQVPERSVDLTTAFTIVADPGVRSRSSDDPPEIELPTEFAISALATSYPVGEPVEISLVILEAVRVIVTVERAE